LRNCLYPGCTHVNDDPERTDLCGCHLLELLNSIKRLKKENPHYKGVRYNKIIERLTRTQILKLLNVDEETIRKIVSKAKPPYDFEMIPLGTYHNEKERIRLKRSNLPEKYYNYVGKRELVYCSVFSSMKIKKAKRKWLCLEQKRNIEQTN